MFTMKRASGSGVAGWLGFAAVVLCVTPTSFGQSAVVEKTTVPREAVERFIEAECFDPGFPQGDSNYNALTAASDGKMHFVVNTHDADYSCRYYTFDPDTETMTLVGTFDKILGEDAATHISEGKVHTPLIEHDGKIWFATHTSFYADGLPGVDSGEKKPYPGGRFMNYDLASGRFTDLAQVMPPEGIITMNMDRKNEILYGLTWPSGVLFSYDVARTELRSWGSVQGRGEWGHHPFEWRRICRHLGIDPAGNVYGSTMDGRIWKYTPGRPRPVEVIEGLDLSALPFSQSAAETLKGDFQHNWRVIQWNPNTESFWGLHFETTTLFEFNPASNYLRAVAELRPEAYRGMPRNPEISQLGFLVGPENTIFYLAHGPAIDIPGRPALQSGLYLLTYDIDSGKLDDHGPVFSSDGRRVFFAESLAIGPDDHLYTVAWVEVVDPGQAREDGGTGPEETAAADYQILLTRLPKWTRFVGGRR